PLTPNGKLDRRALPDPEQSMEPEHEYVAPRTVVEQQLVAIWREVLGVEQVGVFDDFFALGGHSLLTVRLMTQIEQTFGKRLPVAAIFQGRTVESLARIVTRHSEDSLWSSMAELHLPTVDLQNEAELDLLTCPEVWPGDKVLEVASIFLSGATGFIGTFLLHELLKQTSADIFCLVRATSIEDARAKLQRNLKEALLWEPAFGERIHPIVGDLTLPRFGLSAEVFEELAQRLDLIYHNGAQVNMVYPYQELKAANVLGTKEILWLATHGKIKPLHYISTLGVLPHRGLTRVQQVNEQEAIDEYHEHVRGGYAQSKWVAEKLVTIARSRGLPVVIYRPGRVTGHSRTGAWRSDDVLCRVIKGCIQAGCSPVFSDEEVLEMTPVDYISQAIVALSRRKASLGQSFHLLNPSVVRVNELIDWINASGYSIRRVPYEQWLEQLGRATDNVLSPFLTLLPRQMESAEQSAQALKTVYDDRATRLNLSAARVACPPADAGLIHAYLSYMVKSGFLPAPQESASFKALS
ncbi:MAG TPA: thioester reductase domain-containing protein, partial [Ktedonobacteraceae bacterium]|nr:thioester reductase domain-containing protein [Ktedonobacteraceae bacterium]